MNTSRDILLHRHLFGRALLPFVLVVGACGGNPQSLDDPTGSSPSRADGTGADPASGDPSSDDDPTPAGDAGTPPPPCDEATTAAIQASIDKAIPDDIDGVAFVIDPSCGERYFTHGPSKYPLTTGHFIGSNTKTYVASLILLLVDEGLLKLDDPISKWLDNVPGGDAITVRQTLNHSSGLFTYNKDQGWAIKMNLKSPFTPDELIGYGFSHPVSFPAGQGYEYSNTNYVVLGRIAELIKGKPLAQLFRQYILDPIGAKRTYLRGNEEPLMDLAVARSGAGKAQDTWGPSACWAAGGMAATVDELARWTERRGSKAFHSAAANAALFDIIATNQEDFPGYGAGMFEFSPSITRGGGVAYGHGGDVPGYHSLSAYFPEKKTTVVVAVDTEDAVDGKIPSYPYFFAVVEALFGGGGRAP